MQDLGIPQEKFDQLASDKKISLEFIKEKPNNISDPENIIGIITIKAKVDKDLIDKFPNLKFIAVAFTGYDCIDLDFAREKGITVFNVPTYATDCTAELAIGLALSLFREIPKGQDIIMSGGWDMRPGVEIAGKTVGIIGTGAIGVRVAKIFKAFKCNIIGWSRSKREEFTDLGGVYKEEISDVFRESDIVTIHLLFNQATKGIIGMKELSLMKKSAFLINVARGPIVNTNDLADCLRNEVLAGAAVDVFDVEPIEKTSPLLSVPNVLLTPHIAYKTEESLIRRAEVTLENIKLFLENKPQNVIS